MKSLSVTCVSQVDRFDIPIYMYLHDVMIIQNFRSFTFYVIWSCAYYLYILYTIDYHLFQLCALLEFDFISIIIIH